MYLLTADFDNLAQKICDMVNSASADLSAERREFREIETKINNGVNAILSGIDIPELSYELDRLRVRKSELDDIILYNEKKKAPLNKNKVIQMLRNAVENWGVDDKAIVQDFITKIYAHVDGSATVNIGVHINGKGLQF